MSLLLDMGAMFGRSNLVLGPLSISISTNQRPSLLKTNEPQFPGNIFDFTGIYDYKTLKPA